jgi:hypothetical protein
MQMARWAARIGAVFYVLWGVFHLVAANAVYALAEQSTGMVRGRLLTGCVLSSFLRGGRHPDGCPYRKPHPASEQTANRVMFVPDDRFSHVTGMRADQALPIEGTA